MCDDPSWVEPIHEFAHDEFRCAIIGGYVYRGSAIPDLQGAYLFSDYCTSRIFALRHDGSAMTELVEWTDELEYVGGTPDLLCSWAVDNEGELYLLDFADGEIFKLEPAPPCLVTRYCDGEPNSVG